MPWCVCHCIACFLPLNSEDDGHAVELFRDEQRGCQIVTVYSYTLDYLCESLDLVSG